MRACVWMGGHARVCERGRDCVCKEACVCVCVGEGGSIEAFIYRGALVVQDPREAATL
jgi:hypothetical protein